MVGQKLANRYHIIEKIGTGGMAIVYKARCTLLNRIVAVKVLKAQFVHDQELVRRFRREAQASAGLSHPNIVGIYDVGQDKQNYFIVMEYVAGQTLKDYINEGKINLNEVLNIAKNICKALKHAHDNSIIHRDIKPQNILLTKEKHVKVTDFGIAKAINTDQTLTMQNTNTVLGSVHYFSPEQAKGNYAGAQSDIYSLGIVMYEMLTGKVPFDGDSPISVAIKHIQEPVRPLDELNADIPEGVSSIVKKAVTKNKDMRYKNAEELLNDIRSWLNYGAVEIEESDELDQKTQRFSIAEATEKEDADEIKGTQKGKAKAKKITTIVLISLLLVAGLIGGGYALTKRALHVPEVPVPNVEGLPLSEAIKEIEDLGLQYVIEGEEHSNLPTNHVLYQSPSAGSTRREGREVSLILSLGAQYINVPDIVGETERSALNTLSEVGFEVEVNREYDDAVESGKVISQSPSGGSLQREEVVSILVSEGPKPVNMPGLIDKDLNEANDLLEQLGLNYTTRWIQPQGESPSGIVVDQNPSSNDEILPGQTTVELSIRPYERIEKTVEVDVDFFGTHVRIVVEDIEGMTTVVDERISGGRRPREFDVRLWEGGEVRVFVDGELQ
ncbi:Stk1 family PASTA domain-containing Ser/Thr kinase [Proteinivorax hydrogeniformans]|uniref:non-specific serine/threonine protein kinase n=1 Tax=Proteinivorax hydrogeniformans TaxID=1826727 RepID=A0AAU8HPE9_9FIRM